MGAVGEETLQPCPQCGAEIRADARFVRWCAACDWNVDPQQVEGKRNRLENLRHRLAQRHGEQLVAELGSGAGARTGRDSAGLLAYALALVVHGVTVALLASGSWLLVGGWGEFAMVPGVILLGLAWPLRPRLRRLPTDAHVLRRADAPELYALIDEVGQAVGTRGVDAVVVDAWPNAGATHYGVGRRLLTLGLPLWEVLTPQQRIALLGHELGHFTNGDTRHGLVVGTACRSLAQWAYYFAPIANPSSVEMIVNLFYLLPRLLVQGMLVLFELLTARTTQRSEYLADSMAARAGSTRAAAELMDLLLVTDSITTTLHRETNSRRMRSRSRTATGEAEGLWEALTAHMDSVPESEYERQRRAGALRGHRVDSTHPPTHLRRRLLLTAAPVPASVTIGATRSARIAEELATTRKALARDLVRDGFDGA